jgi:hypothetical protein
MNRVPILHNLAMRHDTLARVYVNDLPLFRGTAWGPLSQNAGMNYLLVPGENELRVELLRAPKPAPGVKVEAAPDPDNDIDPRQSVELKIFKPIAHGSHDVEMIHVCRFPDVWKNVDEDDRRLPYHHVDHFDPDVSIGPPAFLSSPPTDFECEGTAELHAAVSELHAAMVAKDVRLLIDLMSLQISEYARAFEGTSGTTVSDQEEAYEELFAEDVVVSPLELGQLHFTPRAGGRVAEVTRFDGKPVYEILSRGNSLKGHSSDPVFTQHQGQWRVM